MYSQLRDYLNIGPVKFSILREKTDMTLFSCLHNMDVVYDPWHFGSNEAVFFTLILYVC